MLHTVSQCYNTCSFLHLSSTETEPVASVPSPDDLIIEEADKLYHSYEILPLYNHLIQHKDTNNEDILWRLARATRDVANIGSTSPDDKKRLTYEALECVKRALDINSTNYACHKVRRHFMYSTEVIDIC